MAKMSEERRRIRSVLLDPQKRDWSNSRIAKHCRVERKTVGWVRTDMEEAGEIEVCPTRVYVGPGGQEIRARKSGDAKSHDKRRRPDARSAAKEYRRGWWEAKADERNIDARELHHMARQVRANDRESKAELTQMLREARKQLRHYGYDPRPLGMHLAGGHVEDDIPALDVVAESMARTWPQFFHDCEDDAERRLLELLAAGIPKPITEADAYEQALASLDRWRGGYADAA